MTFRSRIDGERLQVLFREGEDVRPGDLLAQIDPRPVEAQLQQAEAGRDRNTVLLETAGHPLDGAARGADGNRQSLKPLPITGKTYIMVGVRKPHKRLGPRESKPRMAPCWWRRARPASRRTDDCVPG